MDEFDGFEAERRKGIQAVFSKYSDRILHLESFRPWLVGLGALGALIAALSRLDPDGTPGLVALIVGVVFAFVGAACAAAMDFKKIELGAQLKSLEEMAEKAIQLGREVAADRKKLEEGAAVLDRRRRGRLQAIEQMLQAIEAGLLASDEDAKKATAATMLRRSITSIRNAVDYHATEFFTVSIFRREDERMVRIAAEWTNPDLAGNGGRNWKKGQGYTGGAWHRAETNPNGDVVLSDTTPDHVAEEYPVEGRDAERERHYKSVAAIPILIRHNNEVWGVVTATSDRIGMFDRSGPGRQNVEMIRDIARIAALLAGLNGQPPRRRAAPKPAAAS